VLTDLCVYTIRHSNHILASMKDGGRGTYAGGRNWIKADVQVLTHGLPIAHPHRLLPAVTGELPVQEIVLFLLSREK
jgi:hypothetical protein